MLQPAGRGTLCIRRQSLIACVCLRLHAAQAAVIMILCDGDTLTTVLLLYDQATACWSVMPCASICVYVGLGGAVLTA